MNKKIKISVAGALVLSASVQFFGLQARGDGSAVAGALGGLAVGTMIGSAAASNDRRSSRAERETYRAQDKADREQERVNRLERELDRRDLEHRLGNSSSIMTVLVVIVVLLLIAVIGLGVFVFRRKF